MMEKVKKILDIAVEKQKEDCDSVFVVVGRERSGKSTFTLHCMDYLGATPDQIVVDKNKLGETLKKLKDGDAFHFDEAADGLFSKDAQSWWNKNLEKLFMIAGAKKLITFLVIPDFFLLSPYFREKRISGLFIIKKRGVVCFYTKRKIDYINYLHKRYRIDRINVSESFYDFFPNYEGRLLAEYLVKKNEKINSFIDFFSQNSFTAPPKQGITKKQQVVELLSNGWRVTDIARKLGIRATYVSDIKRSITKLQT